MLFTIGHSTHDVEYFLMLLQKHHITAVADVRSSPYSKFAPQFIQENIRRSLRNVHISYVFLGKELGARSPDAACYINGKVQYARLAQQKVFIEGARRVMNGMYKHRIALMCAEKDPIECHRALLVARYFFNQGIEVSHILADGDLETHKALEERLLKVHKMAENDLFLSQADRLLQAYLRQEDKVAYQDEHLASIEEVAL